MGKVPRVMAREPAREAQETGRGDLEGPVGDILKRRGARGVDEVMTVIEGLCLFYLIPL